MAVEADELRRCVPAGGHAVGLVDEVGQPLLQARELPAPEVVMYASPFDKPVVGRG